MRNIPTFLIGAALTLAAVIPAQASPRYGHYPYRPGYRPSPPAYRPTPPPVYRPGPATPRERKEYQAQLRLRQLGYYRGPVDGSIGPVTQRAIARFQRDRRLPITSWLDVRTLRALGVI